jgi:hypothetical protein
MGDAPLVRLAVHQQPEGLLQRGALLACTLDFQAGRDAAATGAAPRCTEVGCVLRSHDIVSFTVVMTLLLLVCLLLSLRRHRHSCLELKWTCDQSVRPQ